MKINRLLVCILVMGCGMSEALASECDSVVKDLSAKALNPKSSPHQVSEALQKMEELAYPEKATCKDKYMDGYGWITAELALQDAIRKAREMHSPNKEIIVLEAANNLLDIAEVFHWNNGSVTIVDDLPNALLAEISIIVGKKRDTPILNIGSDGNLFDDYGFIWGPDPEATISDKTIMLILTRIEQIAAKYKGKPLGIIALGTHDYMESWRKLIDKCGSPYKCTDLNAAYKKMLDSWVEATHLDSKSQ